MSRITVSLVCFALISLALACKSGERVIASGKSGDVSITISSPKGQLTRGNNELILTFSDASGKGVDVGAASLNFNMSAMGSMAEMNNRATLTTTETVGKYRAVVDLEMAGTWQAHVKYDGPAGSGQASMTVQPK
jgi:YtkA-like